MSGTNLSLATVLARDGRSLTWCRRLRGGIVVGGWIWIGRTRKWRWETIGIGRRLIVLAVASRRRRVLIAGMGRILTEVSKFNSTAPRAAELTGY
jgi:hypothetical protein